MSDAKPAEAKAAAPAGKPPVHPYKRPEVYQRIAARFGGRVTVETDSLDGAALVKPEDLVEVARFCRDDPGVDCAMLHLISGVDYLADKKIQVVYHLESLTGHYMVVLKCDLPRDDPVVPSLVELWPAADWQERETFDLMGVIFDGHPNLRRILCSEDWEGHPLRKDYVFPAYYHGIPNIFFEHLLTEEQKKLLYADMNEEQRRLLYGTAGESK